MTCSVIIPCHPRNRATLPRTLQSLEVAAEGLDVEQVVVEDPESKGLSWARNRGIERAKGDVIFFCDADDTVRPDFFRHPLAALERSDADFCIFQYAAAPLKRDYDLTGNAAIRAALLPAYIGFSMGDVRRWNAGGDLFANREPGSVCRVALRRAFLGRHRLRFDEKLFIYEDAPFMAACALHAERVVSLRENLYDYEPSAIGITATVTGRQKYWDYKFAIHARRLALEAEAGGVWSYCDASAVFTLLELMRAHQPWRRFLGEPRVRESLAAFPVSLRHPLVALAVTYLRCLSRI